MNKQTAAIIAELNHEQMGRFVEMVLSDVTDNKIRQYITMVLESKPSPKTGEDAVNEVVDTLYPMWREAVKSKECTPAKAATQKFIKKHSGADLPKLSVREGLRVWECWKAKGSSDGLLVRNINYAKGRRIPEYFVK